MASMDPNLGQSSVSVPLTGVKRKEREDEPPPPPPSAEPEAPPAPDGQPNALAMSAIAGQIRAQEVERELKERDPKKARTEPKGEAENPVTEGPNLQGILAKATSCFSTVLEINPLTLETLMRECVSRADSRFLTAIPVSEAEIQNLHELFFGTELLGLSQAALVQDDPCHPSVPYLVHTLFDCLSTIRSRGGCQECLEAFECHLEATPQPKDAVATLMEFGEEDRASALRGLAQMPGGTQIIAAFNTFQSTLQTHRQAYSTFPIVPTTRLFGSINVNQTFALHDSQGKICFIFKPQELNRGPFISMREHTASLISRRFAFPVPKTVLVTLGEWTGSAQLFVSGCTKKDAIKKSREQGLISKSDAQKIVIFDLLFGNCDRNEDNIIFKKAGRMYKAYAIDHDRCFGGPGESMLQYYEIFPFLNQPFDSSVSELLSDEALAHYSEVMGVHEMDKSSIEWMHHAAQILLQGIEEGRTINKVVEILSHKFEGSHL